MDNLLPIAVGGFIGFASSYFTWKVKTQTEKKNIAHALFMEISFLEDRLQIVSGMLSTYPPGVEKDAFMPK